MVQIPECPRVGLLLSDRLRPAGRELGDVLSAASEHGIDHVGCMDHVAFRGGRGFDGLVGAALLAAAHPSMPVRVGVLGLSLRHPVLVARQIADLAAYAPGRIEVGIGVGGDDPAECRACGVDPRTRGSRTDESLAIVRRLLRGETVNHTGRHFAIDGVVIEPRADVPITVGGRSVAALARAAILGDGWTAFAVGPERFDDGCRAVDARAVALGRPPLRHSLQVWCSFAAECDEAEDAAAAMLEGLYGLPFDRWRPYVPCGPPDAVAEMLAPFTAIGCSTIDIMPIARSALEAVAYVASVRTQLAGRMERHAGLLATASTPG